MANISQNNSDIKPWVKLLEAKRNSSIQDTTNYKFSNITSSTVDVEKEIKELKFGGLRGKAIQAINSVLDDSLAQTVTTSHANKLWVAAIGLKRLSPNINGKDTSNRENIPPESTSGLGTDSSQISPIKLRKSTPVDYTDSNINKADRDTTYQTYKNVNKVYIINISTSPYKILELQNRPNEIQINTSSNWVDVNSMGRNNPYSIYTGGNETFSIDISWYANQKGKPEDVLAKCKLLESWSKADGYLASPPILKIVWGDSDIFSNYRFILKSASYSLQNFNSVSQEPVYGTSILQKDGTWLDKKSNNIYTNNLLYPTYATQSLIFQRVTENNLRHVDIIPNELLFNLNGYQQ